MLTPTEKIWHNGRFIPWKDATIHVLSHVVSYGSSVFEGIRCYATPAGPAVFRLREHVRRLIDSAKIYRMENLGYSQAELARSDAGTGTRQQDGFLLHPADRDARLRRHRRERHEESRSKSTSPAGTGASIWAKRRWPKAWTSAFRAGPAWRPTPCPRWPKPAPTT